METIWLELVLIAVAILANGFFAGSEIALVSSRISRLAQLRQEATTGAAKAMSLKERPERFLATIQIAITAVGTLASAVGGAAAVEALTPWLAGLGLPGAKEWAGPVALGIVVLLITYVSLVIGELAPKAVALRNPERIACLVAPAVFWLSRISSAVVRALTASTNAVLRVLGQGTAQESPFTSEEEVRYLVRQGAAKGIFEKVEEELVHNVFEFADTTVREIMTPRPHIQGLDMATPAEEVLRRAVAIGHSPSTATRSNGRSASSSSRTSSARPPKARRSRCPTSFVRRSSSRRPRASASSSGSSSGTTRTSPSSLTSMAASWAS